MQRQNLVLFGTTPTISSEYTVMKNLSGTWDGPVISARHRRSGVVCAIRKIKSIKLKNWRAQKCLRQIRLLSHFRGHKNIVCLYDIDIIFNLQDRGFDDVYIYEELMGANLKQVITSGQPLTDAHFQFLVYQMLCGLKYIHSAGVVHHELRPSSILINADCELKISDFTFARSAALPGGSTFTAIENPAAEAEVDTSTWYRAPEVLFGYTDYSTPVDIWSVGCIFAELLGGKPIWMGQHYMNPLKVILAQLDVSEDVLRRIAPPRARDWALSLPAQHRSAWATVFPLAIPLALELLSQLLLVDPGQRLTCEQALNQAYLEVWQDPDDQPVCELAFDFEPETTRKDSVESMTELILEKAVAFRAKVRAEARAEMRARRKSSLSLALQTKALSSRMPEAGDSMLGGARAESPEAR